MSIKQAKAEFESRMDSLVYESSTLVFHGVDGFTVYNCSIPFLWEDKEYIYGRVEKLTEWARSTVRLFEKTGKDEYTLVRDHMIYSFEDPFVSFVQGELVLGGVHVRKQRGNVDTYHTYFYRGTDINDLTYFTTGPGGMKDIRLVDMKNGKIGVFSRPRNKEIEKLYGSGSVIGFAQIDSLDELSDEVIANAKPIPGIFEKDEWGGCNQVYLLENGKIGIIGHQCFFQPVEDADEPLWVYLNVALEFDPETFAVSNHKVIGTRKCYPDGPAKLPVIVDCTFTSGIVARGDGKADLYGGIGDAAEGRILIDYPFSAPIR